jgi:hypothetical protein
VVTPRRSIVTYEDAPLGTRHALASSRPRGLGAHHGRRVPAPLDADIDLGHGTSFGIDGRVAHDRPRVREERRRRRGGQPPDEGALATRETAQRREPGRA